jgi:hypothetical protein
MTLRGSGVTLRELACCKCTRILIRVIEPMKRGDVLKRV